MNYQLLYYFKRVAELEHYTQAAETLYISQPALSRAMHSLERELGVILFEKKGRGIALSPYGRTLYEYVSRAFGEMEKGLRAVRRLKEIERDTVFVSAIYSMYSSYLSDKVLAFRRGNPGCRFSVEYKYTTAVLRDISEGISDLGICSNFIPEGEWSDLSKAVLYTEPLGILAGPDHPFYRLEEIDPRDLKGEKFLVPLNSRVGTNQVLYALCRQYGFEPGIAAEIYDDRNLVSMADNGEGIVLFPLRWPLVMCHARTIPINSSAPIVREINLVWNRLRILPPLTAAFRDQLLREANGSETR